MKRAVLTIFFTVLFAGCASNYHMKESRELSEPEKIQRLQELEQAIKKLKPGAEITLLLYDGETKSGSYYSYMDGFVTLRIEDSFRDTELTDVRGISAFPKERMKTVMEILILATMVGIITTFVITH